MTNDDTRSRTRRRRTDGPSIILGETKMLGSKRCRSCQTILHVVRAASILLMVSCSFGRHRASRAFAVVNVDAFLFRHQKQQYRHQRSRRTPSAHVGITAGYTPNVLHLSSSSTTTTTTTTSGEREHKVTFIAPLLDYGYPPAVHDLELEQHDRYNVGDAVLDAELTTTESLGDDTNTRLEKHGQHQKEQKPILLYLPGFDGTFLCPFIQFPELQTEFDVWCMTVSMDDRSTYQDLKAIVLDFIQNELLATHEDDRSESNTNDDRVRNLKNVTAPNKGNGAASIVGEQRFSTESQTKKSNPGNGIFANWFGLGGEIGSSSIKQPDDRDTTKEKGRAVYIAGESFGGILASDVVLAILEQNQRLEKQRQSGSSQESATSSPPYKEINLQGLILINPATCYDRSQLAIKGPKVARTPNVLYAPTLFSQLLPLFTDEYSVEQLGLILSAKALPSVIDNPMREAYMGRVACSLPTKLEFMPSSTLSWRLEEWLTVGCETMSKSTFESYPSFRTLIVVGEKDKTLPSIAEAERLASKVLTPKQTQIFVVEGAGHSSTCGSRVDLTAVIRNRFTELLTPQKQNKKTTTTTTTTTPASTSKQANRSNENDYVRGSSLTAVQPSMVKRTDMKPEAKSGTGAYFGMESRYDGASIGLNPILYWSKDNYRRVNRSVITKRILIPGTLLSCSYSKARYEVPSKPASIFDR